MNTKHSHIVKGANHTSAIKSTISKAFSISGLKAEVLGKKAVNNIFDIQTGINNGNGKPQVSANKLFYKKLTRLDVRRYDTALLKEFLIDAQNGDIEALKAKYRWHPKKTTVHGGHGVMRSETQKGVFRIGGLNVDYEQHGSNLDLVNIC